MADVTLKAIREELVELRKEITGLKKLLTSKPELREDVIKEVNEARERIKKDYVSHEKVTREFLG